MIKVQDLFDEKAAKYGSSGERFTAAFVRAVNACLRDLKNKSFITKDPITNLESSIDIDEKYYNVISDITDYWIQSSGEWATSEKRNLNPIYRMRLGEAWAMNHEGVLDGRIGVTS